MFTLRFATADYRPDRQITLRTNLDNWAKDIPGLYENGAWRFELPIARYGGGFTFKFVLERTYWQNGPDLFLQPVSGGDYLYQAPAVTFPPMTEVVVENTNLQQEFFPPNLNENRLYDVIVVGSGIGGGILADQLSDLGLDVLVLEAGSYLFPTHTANLPRQHRVGQFDKHVWNLYERFKVQNFANGFGSAFDGGQAFNLGGKSLFWGGLIPRMAWWELDRWPRSLRWFLEGGGYQQAEDLMNRVPLPPTPYRRRVKQFLRQNLAEFTAFDAPMAVQYSNPQDLSTVPTGMFSTADLLTESMLTNGPQGNQHLFINLNHPVSRVETQGNRVTRVVAYDLIAQQERSYQAKAVVLAAGTVESAKIAQLSGLADPTNKIGVGITDHPIYFTHFALPVTADLYDPNSTSKVLLQPNDGKARPYNVVLEFGADFNQGRYVDLDLLDRHRRQKGNLMLCEIVFLMDAPLIEANTVQQVGPAYVKPVVQMQPSPLGGQYYGEMSAIKDQLIAALGGQPLVNNDLSLKGAGLGGVAHEVGSLRMSGETDDGQSLNDGVVDTNLKFLAYDNLYACDLSVFPSSPAANPTLTLAALAIRLAEHLKEVV
ncbi:GMC family oxidoreductase [Nodosilinea sp. LEGE 06152]|uniref:GMC oxidoreductase n=1 Tax=Nodosilinea sp. LEGE 06152 TaxID=2777966 RepID=UPI00188054D0|nr:GMC oxidoreductase [Nodosilinea sp. LEGE 06152]MBE9158875.1 GMC family oxidoreductase [Nodosilinea sp. LEGE 06152]